MRSIKVRLEGGTSADPHPDDAFRNIVNVMTMIGDVEFLQQNVGQYPTGECYVLLRILLIHCQLSKDSDGHKSVTSTYSE